MRVVSWKSGNAIAVCMMTIVLGQFAVPVTGWVGDAQERPEAGQSAREAQSPAKPASAEQPGAKPDAQPPEPSVEALRRQLASQPINVRFDITINEQAGTDPPVKKTLNVIAADRSNGSIRSKVTVAVPTHPPGPEAKNYSYQDLPLNVDCRPELIEGNRIRAHLIMNYETFTVAKERNVGPVRSIVTVNQIAVLENGKPMTVSQSADAATDRKVTIELKATILR